MKLNRASTQNLTSEESQTFKIAAIWEEEVNRIFPKKDMGGTWYRQNFLPKKGNVRKGHVFRHCWKVRRELRGLIEPEQMRMYVVGNLMILKRWDSNISINSLCGDKAWVRWKVYERWYRRKENETVSTPELTDVDERKIVREIDRVKKFIFESCEGEPTKEKIDGFIEDKIFQMWVNGDRISKYYVILSPFVKEHVDLLAEECNFRTDLFEEKATKAVRAYFQEEFIHEFNL